MPLPSYASLIRNVPDFPTPGVQFKDITTLLANGPAFHALIDDLSAPYAGEQIEYVIGVESRGFLLAAPLAYHVGAGLVLVRKPGKLPSETIAVEYALEYGTNALHMHRDAFAHGARVLIVDDVLATGGTVGAVIQLVEQLGGVVVGLAFAIELTFLNGREKLGEYPIRALIQY